MSAPPQPQPKNPFKGLRPFEQSEEDELFGRERDLILMKDRILSSRTTLLFAGSGVGKTSFLNAAVIPALQERYCVVWHNRWTGAEEKTDTAVWDDHRHLRIWPPRAFFRWLGDRLVQPAWVRQRNKERAIREAANGSNDDSSRDETKSPQRKVGDAVQSVISHSLRPGNKRRLSRVLSIFKKKPDSSSQQKPCILILDQFEEIFQYHAYAQYFQDFISDLSKVINDDTYQVRVVFSMREEFLGELSVFDNRIPDLFNNYYRLRYPEKDEAKFIITETCKLVDIEPAPENLDKLVDDLATIEKGFEPGTVPGDAANPVRLVHRNFVPPPYLQIVCDMLWKEQFENSKPVTMTSNGDGPETKPGHFLKDYQGGYENPADFEESDAQKAVREFCEAKLSPPFLKQWEQKLAARAFGFLVTKQGAKMAYELRSLAFHMDERVWPLKHTLEKLSQPHARILRETRGPEGSYWFELYHDMYAGVVDRWNRTYTKAQRRRQRLQLIGYGVAIAAMILMPIAALNWIKRPRAYEQIIVRYTENLQTTDLKNDKDYNEAFYAYSQLENTFGYAGTAHSLWAKVWKRRAQLFEAKEQRDEALLSFLQAAALTEREANKKDYINEANNLLLGDEESIKNTLCKGCRIAAMSRNGRYVVTAAEGLLSLSNLDDQTFHSTICVDCTNQTKFSANSKLVAVVRQITNDKSANGDKPKPASAVTAANPGPGTASLGAKQIIGWEVRILRVQGDSYLAPVSLLINNRRVQGNAPTKRDADSTDSQFYLDAIADTPAGYLVAGVVDEKLSIWRQDGSEVFEMAPRRKDLSGLFSPDGRFFGVVGSGIQPKLWQIDKTGFVPFMEMDASLRDARQLLFSPSSKYVVVRMAESIRLFDLVKKQEALSLGQLSRIKPQALFARDSDKFLVTGEDGKTTIWDSDTRMPAAPPLNVSGWAMFIGKDAKSLILSQDDAEGYEEWSFETGKRTGKLDVNSERINYISSNGESLLLMGMGNVRLWGIPPVDESKKVRGIIGDKAVFQGLSDDGNIMLVSDEGPSPTTFRVIDIVKQTEIFSFKASRSLYRLSPDASRVAVRKNENEVDLFSSASHDPQKLSFDTVVRQIAFSDNSRFLAIATDGKVAVYDTQTGNSKQFDTRVKVPTLVFTPDSQHLLVTVPVATVGEKPVSTFDLTQGKPSFELWSVPGAKKVDLSLTLSQAPDAIAVSNTRVAIFQNNKILIFEVNAGTQITNFSYPGDIAMLSLTEDGKLLVTCDRKGALQVWDTETGKPGPTISIGTPANRIFFDKSGKSFLVRTSYWVHRIERVDDTLRYDSGIYIGIGESLHPIAETIVQTGENQITSVKWVQTGLYGFDVNLKYFRGNTGLLVFPSDTNALLQKWKAKLNYDVRPDGFLSNGSEGSDSSGSY